MKDLNWLELITEQGSVSLGRVAFWLLLGVSLARYWLFGVDVPPGLVEALMALLLYGLGKRYINETT